MSEGGPDNTEQPQKRRVLVAEVLDTDQVALNIGRKQGVAMGQRYLIYELSEEEVTDPVTGESLGRVEIPKGTGRIVNVQENLSVLESDEELSDTGRRSLASVSISDVMNPSKKAPFRLPRKGDRVKLIFG